MNKKEHCLLWQRAKTLARDRGLEMTDTCPTDDVCEGTECVYLALTNWVKLEEKRTEQKLSDLRREISSLG